MIQEKKNEEMGKLIVEVDNEMKAKERKTNEKIDRIQKELKVEIESLN